MGITLKNQYVVFFLKSRDLVVYVYGRVGGNWSGKRACTDGVLKSCADKQETQIGLNHSPGYFATIYKRV